MARQGRKLIEILGIQGKRVNIVPTTKGLNLTELYSKKKSVLDGYMGAIVYDPKWKKYVLVDLDKKFQMSLECIKEAFEMTEKYWGDKPKPKDEGLRSYGSGLVEAKCQVCGERVMIKKNAPYFGILCAKCSKPKSYKFENKSSQEKKTNKLQYADRPCTNKKIERGMK